MRTYAKISLFLVSLFSFFIVGVIRAHPLDISTTTFSVQTNIVNATTYFHTFEVEWLLRKKGIEMRDIGQAYDHKDLFVQYVKDHIRIQNNKKQCSVSLVDIPNRELYQLISQGLEVNYSFVCPDAVDILSVEIEFFLDFKLQTNRLTIYNLNGGLHNTKAIAYKVFTTEIKKLDFPLRELESMVVVDTDGDLLSDEDERIYKTDPQKADTDSDNYSDYEEVFNSRDPRNATPGPGQKYRETMPAITQYTGNEVINTAIQQPQQSNRDAATFGNSYLQHALQEISGYVDKSTDTSIWYILGLIVLLGFIHAIGPGHSKNLLISYVLDKRKGFWHGLLFSGVFTVTHLIDIVILFALTKFFFSYYDPAQYITWIQRGSAIILTVLSIYLLITARIRIKKGVVEDAHDDHTISKKSSFGKQLWIGFIAGLAPCTFGWSVFLLLFSLNKMSLVIPVLLALGLGIFLCLAMIVVITVYIRNKIYGRVEMFARYSSIVSAVIMLVVSVFLMISLF